MFWMFLKRKEFFEITSFILKIAIDIARLFLVWRRNYIAIVNRISTFWWMCSVDTDSIDDFLWSLACRLEILMVLFSSWLLKIISWQHIVRFFVQEMPCSRIRYLILSSKSIWCLYRMFFHCHNFVLISFVCRNGPWIMISFKIQKV